MPRVKIPLIPRIEHYAPFIGRQAVEELHELARPLRGMRIAHVNSTAYGGGVAELLNSTALLMNDLDIEASWRVIVGAQSFFKATRKLHDGLQGLPVTLTATDRRIYKTYNLRNALITPLAHEDAVIIHDPQPLAMIKHAPPGRPWLWRVHIDLSQPRADIVSFLRPHIQRYTAAIFHLPKYVLPHLSLPTHIMPPAIDPLTPKNCELSRAECERILRKHSIPLDKPLLVQISRFDHWKDPLGVIQAYRQVKQRVPCRLVLMGDMASDDPAGPRLYAQVAAAAADDPDIILCTERNDFLVNALQRTAAVVFQKSLREGFGLTVSEALWKGTPVIGGNVGGIPLQVKHGKTGYLVSTPGQAAKACLKLLKDAKLRARLGRAGHEHVRERFLITRELADYLRIIRKHTA